MFVALVFALLGAVSISAGQDLPHPSDESFIADFAGFTAASDTDVAASHVCIIHAGCVAGTMQDGESRIAYEHPISVRLPLDEEPVAGRATLPLDRPPIRVATI